jgi:hypothetical protein
MQNAHSIIAKEIPRLRVSDHGNLFYCRFFVLPRSYWSNTRPWWFAKATGRRRRIVFAARTRRLGPKIRKRSDWPCKCHKEVGAQ